MRKSLLALMALVCFGCSGCGSSNSGGDSGGNPPPATITGKWEIITSSTQSPGGSYPYMAIETNLTQSGTTVSSGDLPTDLLSFGAQGIVEPITPSNPCGLLPTGTIEGAISG
jgi:hypothetical protein